MYFYVLKVGLAKLRKFGRSKPKDSSVGKKSQDCSKTRETDVQKPTPPPITIPDVKEQGEIPPPPAPTSFLPGLDRWMEELTEAVNERLKSAVKTSKANKLEQKRAYAAFLGKYISKDGDNTVAREKYLTKVPRHVAQKLEVCTTEDPPEPASLCSVPGAREGDCFTRVLKADSCTSLVSEWTFVSWPRDVRADGVAKAIIFFALFKRNRHQKAVLDACPGVADEMLLYGSYDDYKLRLGLHSHFKIPRYPSFMDKNTLFDTEIPIFDINNDKKDPKSSKPYCKTPACVSEISSVGLESMREILGLDNTDYIARNRPQQTLVYQYRFYDSRNLDTVSFQTADSRNYYAWVDVEIDDFIYRRTIDPDAPPTEHDHVMEEYLASNAARGHLVM